MRNWRDFWTDLKKIYATGIVWMKMTQLFRKHSGVLALLYVTMMFIWLDVIFRENFMEDKSTLLCCGLPWNFHGISFVF